MTTTTEDPVKLAKVQEQISLILARAYHPNTPLPEAVMCRQRVKRLRSQYNIPVTYSHLVDSGDGRVLDLKPFYALKLPRTTFCGTTWIPVPTPMGVFLCPECEEVYNARAYEATLKVKVKVEEPAPDPYIHNALNTYGVNSLEELIALNMPITTACGRIWSPPDPMPTENSPRCPQCYPTDTPNYQPNSTPKPDRTEKVLRFFEWLVSQG
jgi:hypothetical protein